MNKVMALTASLLLSTQANSAVFNLTGDIEFHNDVVDIAFTLDSDAANVRFWTDSYQSGSNFDPIIAVWNAVGGSLIGENDDNNSVNSATQTNWDSGLIFPSLNSGNYILTITKYDSFANGLLLSDGFEFDSGVPTALSGEGGSWSIWLDGVDSATVLSPIPEPSTYALMLGGLGLVGFMAYRRQEKQKN